MRTLTASYAPSATGTWYPSLYTADGAFSTVGTESTPRAFWWRPDGRRFFYAGASLSVHAVDCSTPWDLTTGVYLAASPGLPAASGIAFDPSGTYLILSGTTTTISKYLLTTPWDVTTIVTTAVQSVTSTTHQGIWVREDGLLLLAAHATNIAFRSMARPLDLSTITTVGLFSTGIGAGGALGIHLADDGRRLFALSNTVFRAFNLRTPYSATGGSDLYDSRTLTGVDGQDVFVRPDGKSLWVADNTSLADSIRQYTLE
jgi:hypothetical protein